MLKEGTSFYLLTKKCGVPVSIITQQLTVKSLLTIKDFFCELHKHYLLKSKILTTFFYLQIDSFANEQKLFIEFLAVNKKRYPDSNNVSLSPPS